METCYLLDNCKINAFREALTKVGFIGQFNDGFKFPKIIIQIHCTMVQGESINRCVGENWFLSGILKSSIHASINPQFCFGDVLF